MEYDVLLGIVESFCNWASVGEWSEQEITIGTITGTLLYVKHGDRKYQDVISKMFDVDDAYKEWDSDFVMFRVDDKILAIGTYTLDSAATEEDEVAEFTKVLINELMSEYSIVL